jgi:copper chaperone NosL
MTLFACKREYEQIDLGKDGCAHCRMTIMDARFSAEIIDKKGKVFKFDDIICMKQYINENNLVEKDLLLFAADYSNPELVVVDCRTATILQSERFSSPMNGNFAVFPSSEKAAAFSKATESKSYTWETIK